MAATDTTQRATFAQLVGLVYFSISNIVFLCGACAPFGLALEDLAMATTFHHQRYKAKGFCDGCKFHARPTVLRIGCIKFNYVGLFHFVSLKTPCEIARA